MPKYDIPGREGPLTLVRHHEWREYRLELPVETDDPIVVKLLAEAGAVEVPAAPALRHWHKAKPEPELADIQADSQEEDQA